MLNARAVALQGIGFTSLLVGLQGFGAVVERRGGRHGHARLRPVTDYNLKQLHQDDETAVELIVTLVTKGFFDGTFKG